MNEQTQQIRVGIGQILSKKIKEKGWTKTCLASRADISREQLGWILTGKREVTLSTLLKVLSALEMEIKIIKKSAII